MTRCQLCQLSIYYWSSPKMPSLSWSVIRELASLGEGFSFSSRRDVQLCQERVLEGHCLKKAFFFLYQCFPICLLNGCRRYACKTNNGAHRPASLLPVLVCRILTASLGQSTEDQLWPGATQPLLWHLVGRGHTCCNCSNRVPNTQPRAEGGRERETAQERERENLGGV